MPSRVRVQGDYFHGVVPDGAVYVGRGAPGLPRSYFHNPFKVGASLDGGLYGEGAVKDAEHAVDLFEEYVSRAGQHYRAQVVRYLGDQDVACWCPLPESGQQDWCHGVVLLHLAAGNRRWP